MRRDETTDLDAGSGRSSDRWNRIVGGVVVAVIAFSIAGYWTWPKTPWGNTRYAPGYSEKAFRSIRLGESQASVEARLGTPIVVRCVKLTSGGSLNQLEYTEGVAGPGSSRLVREIRVDAATSKVIEVVADVHWVFAWR